MVVGSGAYDGQTGSATLAVERRRRQCLLVEPPPECVEELECHRNSVVRQSAASSAEGESTFVVARYVEQTSTLEPDRAHHRGVAGRLRRSSPARSHMVAQGYVNFRRTGVNDWYARSNDGEFVDRAALAKFERERRTLITRNALARLRGPIGKLRARLHGAG